jgi:TM2 domain.
MKSKTTAALLAFFLGSLGIHNFYLGFKWRALAQLLITVLSFGDRFWVSGLWAFIEGVLILSGKISKDAAGNPFDSISPKQPQQTSTTTSQTVSCPFCGEKINNTSVECNHCQAILNESRRCTGEVEGTTAGSYSKDVFIKGLELNLFQKILNVYWITNRYMLEEFSVKNGILTIRSKMGKCIQSPINDVTSTLFKDPKNNLLFICVKTRQGDLIKIGDYLWTVREDEWAQMVDILQPQESRLSKATGAFSKILDLFS